MVLVHRIVFFGTYAEEYIYVTWHFNGSLSLALPVIWLGTGWERSPRVENLPSDLDVPERPDCFDKVAKGF